MPRIRSHAPKTRTPRTEGGKPSQAPHQTTPAKTPERPGTPSGPDAFDPAPRPKPTALDAPTVDLSTSPNRERVEKALEALKKLLIAAEGALSPATVEDLVRAMATPRSSDLAGAEGVMGARQALQAAHAMACMPPETRAAVTALLGEAGSTTERALLLKAVAARAGRLTSPDAQKAQAPLEQLRAFAQAIRGRGAEELVARTSVVDLDSDEVAEGLQQRFFMSCVPTTIQIVKAEADPIYAWALTGEALTSLDPSSAIASEQKEILEAAQGVAVPRETKDLLDVGEGMWPEDQLDERLGETVGGHYVRQGMASPDDRKAALERVRALLLDGVDVPIIAGQELDHCMVFTDARADETGAWSYLVQDPWTGKGSWLREDDLVKGSTTIGRMKYSDVWVTYEMTGS